MCRFARVVAFFLTIVFLSTITSITPADDKEPVTVRKRVPVTDLEGKSLTEWITALKNPDASQRERAICALPVFGKTAGNHEVINLLLERLEERDASPRARAVMVLNLLEIPKEDRSRVVQGLIGRLHDQQGVVRYHAALGLQRFGEEARPACAALCTVAEDNISWEIRKAALAALISAGHNPKGAPAKNAVLAMYRRASDVASEVRIEVAIGLGALGRTTDREIDAGVDYVLGKMLKDKDPRIVIWAHLSTMALNRDDDATILLIAGYLNHKEVQARRHACLALGAMGPRSKIAKDKLLEAIRDKDPGVAMAAMGAIVNQADGSPAILKELQGLSEDKETTPLVREAAKAASFALRKIKAKPDEEIVIDPRGKNTAADVHEVEGKDLAHWLEELQSPKIKDPSIRERAITALPFFGDAAATSEVVNVLLERIKDKNDPDASPRVRAIMVLNYIDVPHDDYPRVVEALIPFLKDNQRLIRYYTALTLRHFGEEARPACAALAELVDDTITWEVRKAALAALLVAGKNPKGAPDPRAVTALLKGAKDRDCAEIRLEATIGLVSLGRSDNETLAMQVDNHLQNLFQDKDGRVAIWARIGHMNLTHDNEDHIQAIADFLKEHEVPARQAACTALTHLGPRGKTAQAKLIEALNDKENSVILGAIAALLAQGDAATPVLTALQEVSTRKDLPEGLHEAARVASERLSKMKK